MSITVSTLNITNTGRLTQLVTALRLTKNNAYFHRCLNDAERSVLIATVDGQDVGLCVFNRAPTYTPFRRLNIPELQDLNVHPDFRRQGIGAALVHAVENSARAEGYKILGIGVGLGPSYGAAQRLYVRLRYLPDGAGVAYDGITAGANDMRPIDDNLCLMMMKEL